MSTLICVSGLPFVEETLQMGNLLGRLCQTAVTLFTVVRSESERAEAAMMLVDAAASFDVPVADTIVRLGSPATGILQQSTGGDHDMIVLGAHAIRGFWDQLIHSIPQKVTRRADVSVMVARTATISRILICTGGRRNSRRVIRGGARLAVAARAAVTVLHVGDVMPAMYTGLAEMEESLPELLQANTPLAKELRWTSRHLVKKGVSAELKVRQGIAGDVILQEAHAGDYDLLIIGSRVGGLNVFNTLLIGTVTPQIVDHAPCSVMVVRTKQEKKNRSES